MGLVPATSRIVSHRVASIVASCELAIFAKKSSRRDQLKVGPCDWKLVPPPTQ